MKWITRSHVHVDHVACPWLITRFVDSDAEFLFVPKHKVMEIAEKTGAIPFETPGAELHHRDALCTFDAIIENYELTDKAPLRMARPSMPPTPTVWMPTRWMPVLKPSPWATSLRFPDDLQKNRRAVRGLRCAVCLVPAGCGEKRFVEATRHGYS
ncbi:chromate resistance protein ChrB domain-containing protein [uncultured Desulfosarcina sp.]|uniref:chromate resistance protein ChrB domain-containing protein n=1 Tax=uncultured Desulfosarcina sp. TaxID=218289 RepID=UPI0029C810C4|nr:chromate resistance protein ChrB domain-containing protein [uncultured Desulfosarcina sp.]